MSKADILIVEDERIVAEDIKTSLKKLGFDVAGIVSSGEEALKKVETEHPDLVLMDIMLAGEMNGTEAAAQIRSLFNIPVVYLTAYADEDVLARAKLTEPFGYIVKPFEDIELNSAIEIALYKHKMETKLKQSEAWLSTTLRSIGDAVIATDTKAYVTFMNPVAESLTGWNQEDAAGKPLSEVFNIINEQTRENVENPVAKVIRNDTTVSLANHTILITKDGKEIPIDDSCAPIRDEKGNITGIVLVFRDITERKKMEAHLLQSQKMEAIGILAGGIAHDFNNILFPIIGYTELLFEDIEKSSPFREHLNEIYSAAMRATELVKQILTFSRQTSGELELIKIKPIAEEALKLIRSTIPTTIAIKQDITADCGAIKADPTQIHQITMNLATNAYHAMEETGGDLKVSLKEIELGEDDVITHDMAPGAYACLSVADTGKGMDKDLINNIFDPFFTTKGVGKGTGMGLSVIHGIVKSLDGTIHVYSEPGKGTEFRVYFPVAKNFLNIQNIQNKVPILGGIERILLVDDEDKIARLSKQMLEHFGYQVTSCTGSIEALEAFRAAPDKFDMVITDMQMPDMTGDRLSAELVKIQSDIPVLLCTGFSENMSEERAASLGIKGFLLKPIVMRNLAQKVREVLDNKVGSGQD